MDLEAPTGRSWQLRLSFVRRLRQHGLTPYLPIRAVGMKREVGSTSTLRRVNCRSAERLLVPVRRLTSVDLQNWLVVWWSVSSTPIQTRPQTGGTLVRARATSERMGYTVSLT